MATEPANPPAETPAWQTLMAHATGVGAVHLRDLAASRTLAPQNLSLQFGPLLVSYARQRLSDRTMPLLLELCVERDLQGRIAGLLAGDAVNVTEGRAALHTALRTPYGAKGQPAGLTGEVHTERRRMLDFAAALAAGRIPGAGKPIDTIVNIGIGGSDLGPRLVCDALYEQRRPGLRVEFVSNLDGQALFRCLAGVDPARTLFIVASKSFTTVETLTNAGSARHWLEQHGCNDAAAQFVAITANPAAAVEFGIRPDRVFRFWDWVGGRYSVWSSVGLPVAASLGEIPFLEFLHGAHRVDEHFAAAPLHENLPVLLGLIDLWNGAFLGTPTCAIIPYDQRLQLLPAYLSQLIMESNGKSVDSHGRRLRTPSSPIIWGGIGTDAQHAFFQLLHQGTHTVPVEFLIAAHPRHDARHHGRLLAACLAQGQALMQGRTYADQPHRSTHGNQPSTTIIYADLTPEVLGMLLALYEHRTFVYAALLDINPFDQWGVELGKEMARDIVRSMEQGGPVHSDPITRQLLEHCLPFPPADGKGG
jgi:glucose-6-phosphate isomerase